MSESTKLALGGAVVVAVCISAWLLLISPERNKAAELGEQVDALRTQVAAQQSQVSAAEDAKESFPADYRQLIVLGKAVPAEAEAASLLVQLNRLGRRSGAKFQALQLGSGGSEGEGGESGESATPSESSAARLPIGATVGSAGLPVMPYALNFGGGFFNVADFLEALDAQVKTFGDRVVADGRLVTIDGFTLSPEAGRLSSRLNADLQATTYVTPPGEGLTGGATDAGPIEGVQ